MLLLNMVLVGGPGCYSMVIVSRVSPVFEEHHLGLARTLKLLPPLKMPLLPPLVPECTSRGDISVLRYWLAKSHAGG